MEAMLDANLCIRVLRDRPVSFRERFKSEAHSLGISTIVLHELLYGAARSNRPDAERSKVEDFSAHITVVDFDRAASDHAADIKASLAKAGMMIGPNDLLIAGHARSLGLKLITGNLREFSRVDGLRCEDWLAE
jgi:tRNA(fMet)-specific endonuclease VapC